MNLGNNKKHVNLRWMIPGFVMLCNPEIVGFDFLPDFIGYLFIMAGLYYLADMNSKLQDAIRYFERLFFISAVQFAAFVLVTSLSSASEQSTAYLCLTFAVMLFSVIFGIPAWTKTFDGFSYLGMKYETHVTDGSRFNTAKVLTLIFVVCKPFLPFLAELSSLSVADYQAGTMAVNWYEHVDFYRILVIALILAAGIAWLIFTLRAFKPIIDDVTFMQSLSCAYENEIKPRYGLFLLRRTRISYFILGAAVLLHVEAIIDGNNVLIPVITPCLMVLSALVMLPYWKKIKRLLLSGGLFCAASVFYTYAENAYYSLAVSGRSDVTAQHKIFCISACIYQCLFVVSVYLLLTTILNCTKDHLIIKDSSRFDNGVIRDEKGKTILLELFCILCAAVSIYSAVAALSHPDFRIISSLVSALFAIVFWASMRRNYALFSLRYHDDI